MDLYVKCNNNTCTITLFNAVEIKDFTHKAGRLIHALSYGSELFYGVFKNDGILISKSKESEYHQELSNYINSKGKMNNYYSSRNRLLDLHAICLPNDVDTIRFTDIIFNLYQETIVFSPLIQWGDFIESFRDYITHACKHYVLEGFTDIMYCFSDSSDFKVQFNTKKYSLDTIKEIIDEVIESDNL